MSEDKTQEIHDHIDELIDQEFWGQVASEISNLQPPDIAEIISRYKHEVTARIFKSLPDSIKPDVLAARILEGRVAVLCDGTPHEIGRASCRERV